MVERGVTGAGIEKDDDGVRACIAKGLSVVHGDLDDGLGDFESGFFDFVVLNQTLQAVKSPKRVVEEMLRVGKKGIVGFPNFGYWRVRSGLLFGGRMPRTEHLAYEWYDTPNIHFCTVRDFDIFCEVEGIRVERRVYLSGGGTVLGSSFSNLLAGNAIYLLSRPSEALRS